MVNFLPRLQEPPSSHWREVASRLHDTYYTIQDLEPATDYRFRVRAVNREGLRSEPSPATSIYRTLGQLQSREVKYCKNGVSIHVF
jgi:predicted metalloprotease